MKKIVRWFTLTELIISISILAIIWTIGVISYENYNKDARNITRKIEVHEIEKALELYFIKYSKYPTPDKYINIFDTEHNVVLWKQWIIWENMVKELNGINVVPIDPLLYENLTYSTNVNDKIYQIWYIQEE